VPQDASFLSGTLNDFAQGSGIDVTLFKTVLRKLDFSREQFEKNMADFKRWSEEESAACEEFSRKSLSVYLG